jgi:hypothetical protein
VICNICGLNDQYANDEKLKKLISKSIKVRFTVPNYAKMLCIDDNFQSIELIIS